jgi:hypothetical protein
MQVGHPVRLFNPEKSIGIIEIQLPVASAPGLSLTL